MSPTPYSMMLGLDYSLINMEIQMLQYIYIVFKCTLSVIKNMFLWAGWCSSRRRMLKIEERMIWGRCNQGGNERKNNTKAIKGLRSSGKRNQSRGRKRQARSRRRGCGQSCCLRLLRQHAEAIRNPLSTDPRQLMQKWVHASTCNRMGNPETNMQTTDSAIAENRVAHSAGFY